MKKIMPILVVVLFLISATGIAVAVSATNKKNRAENEVLRLNGLLTVLKGGETPLKPSAVIEVLAATATDPENRNELVALQDPQSELERLRAELEEAKKNQRQPRQPRQSYTERMEQMKQEDPEGYAEAVKRREEFQQRMKYNMAERAAVIVDLDTTGMTKEELAVHEELVERMGRVFELTEAMQNPEGGMNRETMHELFSNIHETRPLLEQERTVILRKIGEDMGLNKQESQNLSTYIEGVISATTIQMPHGGRGGSWRGGGSGGGGRGGSGDGRGGGQ